MIQNQLIEYINAQLKLGTSRDLIKAALTGAGWSAQDVEDTMKSIEPVSKPVTSPAAPASGPQVVKVSDLVSGSPSVMSHSTPASSPISSISSMPKEPAKSPMTGAPASTTGPVSTAKPMFTTSSPIGKPMGSMMSGGEQPIKMHSSRGPLVTEIILGVIALVAIVAAGFMFFQSQGLNGQLSTLNTQSASVNSKLTDLKSQTDASTTAMAAAEAAMQGQVAELATELSFYAPSSTLSAGATTSAVVTGTLAAGGKYGYMIAGVYGAKIQILNAKSTSTASVLAAIATSSIASQFQGFYVPGSAAITLTQVNSTTVQ